MFGLFDRTGEKVIEELFMSLLEEFNVRDLDFAVRENISLLEQTLQYRPHVLRMAERMAKQFNGCKEYVTTENVMIWLNRRRYDFYASLILDGGRKRWLGIQVEQFKKYLWE